MSAARAGMALAASTLALGVAGAFAQGPGSTGSPRVTTPPKAAFRRTPDIGRTADPDATRTSSTGGVKKDAGLIMSEGAIPEPTPLDELGKPKIALPTDPIEPYLLQKENGPFMVLAHTFRGPDAPRWAQALAKELRTVHGLPAYVWYVRIQPGHSNIRNVPPTAPPEMRGSEISPPEKFHVYDEAAVLVGDCKSEDESRKLWTKVKHIRSTVLDGLPSIYNWRKKGLSRALMTTNPMRPTQQLYPGSKAMAVAAAMKSGAVVDPSVMTASFDQVKRAPDKLVLQMNKGSNSVFNCKGPFVLQVAEYSGRASYNTGDARFSDNMLGAGKLATAGEDAERLADALNKCRSLRSMRAYTYHDRSSSKVFLGPFNSDRDPTAVSLFSPRNANDAAGTGRLRPFDEIVSEVIRSPELTKPGKEVAVPLAPAQQLTPTPRP